MLPIANNRRTSATTAGLTVGELLLILLVAGVAVGEGQHGRIYPSEPRDNRLEREGNLQVPLLVAGVVEWRVLNYFDKGAHPFACLPRITGDRRWLRYVVCVRSPLSQSDWFYSFPRTVPARVQASFFNEKYLGMYTARMRELRIDEYIDENKNCEDIAMQFLISNTTDLGPIFTSGSYSDSGAIGGISTQHGLAHISTHYRARSDCSEVFTKRFGRFPLVKSHQFVSQMRSWTPFKAPSSWLEYFSNPF